MKALIFAAAAAAALIAANPASAASTLFSDLGPGQSYDGFEGWTVGHGDAPGNSFVASASGSVKTIDIAMSRSRHGGEDLATVSLWTEAGGTLGVQLGSWSITGLPFFGTYGAGHLATIDGITGIDLVGGSTYFLQVAMPTGSSGAWNWNSVGLGTVLLENGVVTPDDELVAGAFDILGGVPEPSTWSLALGGFGIAGMALRRRRAAIARLVVA